MYRSEQNEYLHCERKRSKTCSSLEIDAKEKQQMQHTNKRKTHVFTDSKGITYFHFQVFTSLFGQHHRPLILIMDDKG